VCVYDMSVTNQVCWHARLF